MSRLDRNRETARVNQLDRNREMVRVNIRLGRNWEAGVIHEGAGPVKCFLAGSFGGFAVCWVR